MVALPAEPSGFRPLEEPVRKRLDVDPGLPPPESRRRPRPRSLPSCLEYYRCRRPGSRRAPDSECPLAGALAARCGPETDSRLRQVEQCRVDLPKAWRFSILSAGATLDRPDRRPLARQRTHPPGHKCSQSLACGVGAPNWRWPVPWVTFSKPPSADPSAKTGPCASRRIECEWLPGS